MAVREVHCGDCGEPVADGARGARCVRCRAMTLAGATGGDLAAHASRVARLALALADALALDEDLRVEVEVVALLHDLGKVALPDRVLTKPAPLDDEEWALMRTHTVEGERLIALDDALPASVGSVVRASHERWDGGGYPDGLQGDDIPLAARVVFAADAYDAMISRRPYRGPLPRQEAVAQLRQGAGRQFDPIVAGVLAELVEGQVG